jgi:mannose-1-phosphate guanylyltransferase
MQAMILAAGRGTRLGELGRKTPKVLVEIGGKPLLARQLTYLAEAGVERVVINAHHLADQIVEFVAQRKHPIPVEVSVEPELLGTAGGVRAALDRFDAASPIIVIYGDTIVDAPLRGLVQAHSAAGADATIAVNWLEDTHGKGVVEVDEDGWIVRFVEKPPQPRPGLANAGVYVVERELVEMAPEGRFYDFAIDLFPAALTAGRRLRAEQIGVTAADIGTPDALARAQAALGTRRAPGRPASSPPDVMAAASLS